MRNYLRQKLHQYFFVTLGCVIMGVAINVFYMPNQMLSGGIGGVAVLGYYVAGLPMGLTSLLCNVPLFFLAYKFLDREFIISSLYGILAFSFSLDAFHFLSSYTVVHDKLLACIAGGVLYGIGCSCLYRVGGSSGGTDIIGAVIQKFYSVPISTTGFIFNLVLLFASIAYFGIEPVLYTLLTSFIMSRTCNAFTIGFEFKKNVIIISNHHREIADEIIKVVGRGVTYLHGEGAYTRQEREVLFVVVKLTQLARIRAICRKVDPSAFLIIHDVTDVFGKGFTIGSRD